MHLEGLSAWPPVLARTLPREINIFCIKPLVHNTSMHLISFNPSLEFFPKQNSVPNHYQWSKFWCNLSSQFGFFETIVDFCSIKIAQKYPRCICSTFQWSKKWCGQISCLLWQGIYLRSMFPLDPVLHDLHTTQF